MNLSTTLIKNSHLSQRVLTALSIVTCAYFVLAFLYSALTNYWPGPFVDYWIDIPNVEKFFNGQLTFHNLISAHANVHRLLIPRLLFIADYRFFSGTNTLLISVSILCKIVTLILFNHIIKNQTLQTRLLLNALLFAAIFNAANISNVLHNSNMQWDLASVFACLALYFYSRDCTSDLSNRTKSISLAWLFFSCGFLSQAGALPVIFVFVFIAVLNKKWAESFISVMLAIFVLYLNFAVLPINEPEKPSYESAVAMLIFKLPHVAIFIFKMFSGSIYPIDNHYFIFSWIILVLFIISLALAHKTKHIYNNIFLNIALFAFLMMITIAAARVDFSPNTWPANRYQTNVLLFILSLSLHCYFSIPVWLNHKFQAILQKTIFTFSFISFLITQYYLTNYAVIFGNKVFSAHAYMLTHGANQYNGADLLLSTQVYDRIAESDPFFREHGFAWYANKQAGNGFYKKSKNTGEYFLTDENKIAFIKNCPTNSAVVEYSAVAGGEGFKFSTPLNTTITTPRNTYYALDKNALVIGFATILIDPDHPYRQTSLFGYVVTQTAQYIAEVDTDGLPVCRYSLDKSDHAP